jgi:NodT family efflux transporter outer membrane factor (OMF) lipoprotein
VAPRFEREYISMKISSLSLAVLATLLLGGCAVGPDYHRPAAATALQYKELPGWTAAAPADAAPKGNWWVDFHDPLLDQLEPQVTVSNQSVRASYANYQQALALLREARAGYAPTVGISGSSATARSGHGGVGVGAGVGVGSGIINSGSLEGSASWAPDLWGKVRRTVEQSAASAQASEATLANATLSEQTALATAVIDLRASDAQIDLLQRTVDAYKESLRITQNQVNAGTAPPSDMITARTLLETTQASLINVGVARAQDEHAIAVLVGRTPEELNIAHSTALPSLPTVPLGVPSSLLQRRPDIAIQERDMAAANAAIGVAIAAYYPSLTLSAADGFSQSPLHGLLSIANHVWSLGANASATLFDGGLRHATVDAARDSYEAAVANYRGSVLSAFQQVEDNLAGLRILAQQATVQNAALADATQGAQIALNEYQAGTVDYTTVVSAQAIELSNRQAVLNVQQQQLLDAVALIGALGGGWSSSELGDDPAHPDRHAP